MALNHFFKHTGLKIRHITLYGLMMAILVFLLKWLQWKFLVADHALEIYAGLLAVLFTALGVWIANQLGKMKGKTVVVEKEVYVPQPLPAIINEAELNKLQLSSREYEVLQLLSKGNSNAEIADQLCLSLSTIKTHVSNLFVKMDVKSRTQAIEKAKRLAIVH
ncbi:helix-turn-helix transcriptional regulator [Flavihumibacter solisilvae]|uniref:LuxR family transcriptional regulator n=1 Tax=Flavihumibacter solisilvae TaxID=1349421 RepID=A0A0C1LJ31_9BACT|nr:response regulator transcription factor [Flavihumibacter solisilvae]KIC95408.1 LuxR family transcriptional regulator [Flavihumibacter solisilvae]